MVHSIIATSPAKQVKYKHPVQEKMALYSRTLVKDHLDIETTLL